MKVIIIEDTVYKVTEKEYNFLQTKSDEIKNAQYPLSSKLHEELMIHLDNSKYSYNKVGVVMFDERR